MEKISTVSVQRALAQNLFSLCRSPKIKNKAKSGSRGFKAASAFLRISTMILYTSHPTCFSNFRSSVTIGTINIPQKKLLTPCTKSHGNPAMIQAIIPLKLSPKELPAPGHKVFQTKIRDMRLRSYTQLVVSFSEFFVGAAWSRPKESSRDTDTVSTMSQIPQTTHSIIHTCKSGTVLFPINKCKRNGKNSK